MNTATNVHIDEAQKHLRKALGYSSEDGHSQNLNKLTDILNTLDRLKNEDVTKHELNNSGLRWDNEYHFFPALQTEDYEVQ